MAHFKKQSIKRYFWLSVVFSQKYEWLKFFKCKHVFTYSPDSKNENNILLLSAFAPIDVTRCFPWQEIYSSNIILEVFLIFFIGIPLFKRCL